MNPLFRSARGVWRWPIPSLLLAVGLTGCAGRVPGFSARVTGPAIQETLDGKADASWCRSRGVLLLQGSQGESGVALVWYFGDSLSTDSILLGPPVTLDPARRDSSRAAAAGGYRRALSTAVEGYQTRNGWLVVQRLDSMSVSARFAGTFDRTGTAGSVSIVGDFDRVPLAADTTLCAIPRAAPDTGVNSSR